jgi:hypothetical protein
MRFKNRDLIEFSKLGPWGFLHAEDITDGPYMCDICKQLSCFTHITNAQNRQFCKNPHCNFERVIDKRNKIIRENDGTFWQWRDDGSKVQIRGR